ncbi:MerC domain-containing protein [Galbibacter mesophilus]|uniref:MerC domain-containing protein n=1 Tax=Galbibacter mesophilus TaxID=379069 RepID=UPI001A90D2FD|nr:MerC domain-containing protein [Galbibacter mesophilus]MCM5663212.1 MerC domain-containing protein [Galbibacter mesophilus]
MRTRSIKESRFQLSSFSNAIGISVAGLCLVHCLATPLIFIAQANVQAQESTHFIWSILDIVFLSISLVAIFWSAKSTSKQWMRIALWTNWILIALFIFNEKLALFPLPEILMYALTSILIILHIVNVKYCKCDDDTCCIHPK